MMRLTLIFRDRDGNLGRTSTTRALPATVGEITAEANQFASAVTALSNAVLDGATCAIEFAVSIPPTDFDSSDVTRQLVVIGRSSDDEYASISFPSARLTLPYDTEGPYEGYRLQNQEWYRGNLGRSRRRDFFLAGMVRPDGGVVVPEILTSALMKNQEG